MYHSATQFSDKKTPTESNPYLMQNVMKMLNK